MHEKNIYDILNGNKNDDQTLEKTLENWVDYLLRFLFYLMSKILLLFFLVAIIIVCFLVAKDYMNINVLVGDGFSERANIVLKGTDSSNLSRIFSQECIKTDIGIYDEKYQNYIVRSFIQDVDVDFKLIMPWNKVAVVRTSEVIENIDGEMPADLMDENTPESLVKPPKWDNGLYDVTLQRDESTWKITDIEKITSISMP